MTDTDSAYRDVLDSGVGYMACIMSYIILYFILIPTKFTPSRCHHAQDEGSKKNKQLMIHVLQTAGVWLLLICLYRAVYTLSMLSIVTTPIIVFVYSLQYKAK